MWISALNGLDKSMDRLGIFTAICKHISLSYGSLFSYENKHLPFIFVPVWAPKIKIWYVFIPYGGPKVSFFEPGMNQCGSVFIHVYFLRSVDINIRYNTCRWLCSHSFCSEYVALSCRAKY